MTATSTARLGLMDPVDSDLFLSSDFSATNHKLDAVPGTTIVANYAALVALTWGTAQHMSKVIQADNGAEWYWYNPSGSGVWKRSNTIGILNYTVQASPVATTSGTPVTFVTSGNFTIPGGRSVMVDLNMGLDASSGTFGLIVVNLKDNGSVLKEFGLRPGNSTGLSQSIHYILNVPGATVANNSTHNIVAGIRVSAVSPSLGGGGTVGSRYCYLTIYEI